MCASEREERTTIPPWLEKLVDWTEKGISIPGTRFEFGFDALLGLVPGVGDLAGLVLGLGVVYGALRLEIRKRILGRMLGNLALDAFVGAIPVLGDLFDFVFRANRRNLELLRDELARRSEA